MKCCAVVDTNVLVAALLSKSDDSPTVRVIKAMISVEFIPGKNGNKRADQHTKDPVPADLPELDLKVIPDINELSPGDC